MSTIQTHEWTLKNGTSAFIRIARPDDAGAIIAIQEEATAEGHYTLAEPDELNLSEAKIRERLSTYANRDGRVWIVAEAGDDVAGWLEFHNYGYRRTQHSGILEMWVRKEWRSQGIGTALLQTLLEWAQDDPLIEKVTLAVFHTNTRAIGLYEKLGFEREGYCPRDMKLASGEYIDSVLMYTFVKDF